MSTTANQYGFYFDQSRCIACNACTVACKVWNNLKPSPVKWAKILKWYSGLYPSIRINAIFAPCYHCENPVCVDAANGAMFKEPKYGAVLIDPDKATSASLRAAWRVCPYGAIAFESDAPDAPASMCDMCIGRLEEGQSPICVASCVTRALDFGKLSDLKAKYGTNQQLEGMPDPTEVKPAVVFKPKDARKTLIPYDVNEALKLQAISPNLETKYYDAPDDVKAAAELQVRSKPMWHPRNAAEAMYYTSDDRS